MAGATHFPHGIDVGSLSVNGVAQAKTGSAPSVGATKFPHGVTATVVRCGGTVLYGAGVPATYFPHGIDVNANPTVGP